MKLEPTVLLYNRAQIFMESIDYPTSATIYAEQMHMVADVPDHQ